MEARKNFKCPESGDEFYFQEYKQKYPSHGSSYYVDKYNKRIVHPDTGVELEYIEPEWEDVSGRSFAVHKSQGERLVRNQKYFRQRAKKHSASFDARDEKRDVLKRQLKMD